MSTTSQLAQKMSDEAALNPSAPWTTTECAVELLLTAGGDVDPVPAVDANGNSTVATRAGKLYSFWADGTFGGGTVKLQASSDGTVAYTDIPSSSLTSAGGFTFMAPTNFLRVVMSGATSPSVNIIIAPAQ